MTKTNALRMLEAANIVFTAREYGVSDGEISGVAVARKIGQKPERVFKTLVTEGKTTGLNVFVIPCNVELDLMTHPTKQASRGPRGAALAAGDKYIEMIKSRELEPKTGYVHGGCSPIGMKKLFPTYIDETAQLFDTINVGGGRIGLQIELSPDDLARLTNAAYCEL
ncbi:MAG: Cys-tRNA(Pro) deacylase [Lachnospiraceae bacterium]|jgi:Cys-tRNA(Pro)/Cys-tRNA(Cys) deacylase|nr:Cys-tRNA(Pro) deacylase [Lachnospiraceae bacterium]